MPKRKPTLLITGSTGFVGSALIQHFGTRFDLVGLDLDVSKDPPKSAESIGIDLGSEYSIHTALQRVRAAHGTRIASVIHLAAYFDLSGENDPRYQDITVEGSERLLQALREFDVEQFIFMSTMLVHAPSGHGRCIDESSPLDDRFPYRASKVRTEHLLREQHGDVPLVLLQPSGIYDAMCHNTFLAHQIARIHERRLTSHVYPGDLQAGQPYLHVDDLADAVLQIIERRAELPDSVAVLLAEERVMSFGEIQKRVGRELHDEDWQTVPIPATLASVGAWFQDKAFDDDPFIHPYMVQMAGDHYQVDTSRAAELLGWRARHDLHDELPGILQALKADPVGWYQANGLNAAAVAAKAPKLSSPPADAAEATEGIEGPEGSADADAAHRHDEADKAMDHAPHDAMAKTMRREHFDLLWVHWLNILLGAWLLSSPFAFGGFSATEFSDAVQRVTIERGLADPLWRSGQLARSDVICGLLIMCFGAMSLSPRLAWAQWANAAVGCWLLFAPLVFWAPSAAVYANDTFVGAFVIAFAILVPMMPGMSKAGMMDQSDLPPGWSYSPSTYLQRMPIIALGAFGLLVSRHLAAYQLGHVEGVWEPFFSGAAALNGSETIVTSSVSKAWPIADAGLGAVAYVFEVLMGVMGDRRRWRTMPWMVAMFGIVVVPLGVVSITFVVIQPIVIGTWCTLCLVTAAAMLVMIPYSLDELVAMGQFLLQSRRRGEPFWRTFFRGGAQPEQPSDARPGFGAPLREALASALRGVTIPWTLVLCAALGTVLMFTRILFGTVPPMADSDHLVGAMILTIAVIAMAEVARPLRLLNIPFGVWLVLAPWWLAGANTVAAGAGVVIGIAIIAASLPRGVRSDEHYGAWDRFIV